MEQHKKRITCNIVAALLLLCTYGIIMVYSSSSDFALMKKQVQWVIIGFIAMFVVSKINFRIYQKLAGVGYAASIVMILLLLIPGLSDTSNGATRWLVIFGISIQVAEVVKMLMFIFIASIVSKHWDVLYNWKAVFLIWVYVGIIAAMILFISSNLSSCLILLMVTFSITFISSNANKLHFITFATAGIHGVPYRKDRSMVGTFSI